MLLTKNLVPIFQKTFTKGCKFCEKVGSETISNEQTSFNYRCINNKKSNKMETKVAEKSGKIQLVIKLNLDLNNYSRLAELAHEFQMV
jgi:hypothetical protein